MQKIKWCFLRWTCYLASLIHGFIGVITLGFINTGLTLLAQSWFLDYAENHPYLWNKKIN